MKATVYKIDGSEKGKIDLPGDIFDARWNPELVHQVVVSMQANARTVVAHTKDRSDVRGGGRKPWRQKGTGRARHGSRRSPLWIGGGVTFGPLKQRLFGKKANKKMRAKALFSVLSKKFEEGEVMFVDGFSFTEPKTSAAKDVLVKLSGIKGFEGVATKRNNAVFIATGEKEENTARSFANFGNIEVDEVRNLNAMDLMNNKYLIIANPEKSLEFLTSKIKQENK